MNSRSAASRPQDLSRGGGFLRGRRRGLLWIALAAVAAASCREDPAAPPVPAPPPADAGPGSAPPDPPPGVDVETAKRAAAEDRAAQDVRAQELLKRFRERVWDLGRDGLASAAGEVALVVDGRKGVYRFEFDASRKPGEQVTLTTVSADEGIHADAHAQAKRFVVLSLLGPYHNVLWTLPPTQMAVVGASEGPGTIVVVPPFKTAVGTSYRFGDGGLIDLRGDTDGKQREVARFTWSDWKGRAVLLRADFGDDAASAGETASTSYEYADRDGLPALVRATLVEGVHRCEATLTYASWVRR